MTARIDLTDAEGAVSVRIAGRLDEPAARELLELCRQRTGRLTLDLEELISLDRVAVETLKDLRDAGARIEGASHYVRLLLNGELDPSASEHPGKRPTHAGRREARKRR